MRRFRYIIFGRLTSCAAVLALLITAGVYLAIRIPQALAPIAFGERLFSLFAGLYVAFSAPEEQKLPRLLLLLLLPWLGGILCLFFRRAAPFPATPLQTHFTDGLTNAVSALSYAANGISGGYVSNAEYFRTGREMSRRLFSDLEGAKSEILLDYYILARGKFFDGILDILERKAKEGLDVRLIYDDFGCARTLPRQFAKTLRARGIKATVFHPLRPLPFGRLNRRDHRKLTLIDGNIAYVGGVNLADEYIGETICFGHWKDTALRIEGEPALQATALYKGDPIPQNMAHTGSPCVLFADSAHAAPRVGEEILLRIISATQKTLYLCTPYLAPTARVSSALKSAARAGVKVRIMIPHIPDKKLVFALTRSYARELISAGVKVREYTAGFLHAKSLMADGKYSVVGSYNLDGRSLLLQAENAAFVQEEALAATLERDFLDLWETGSEVKKVTLREKILCFFLRPLSAEL